MEPLKDKKPRSGKYGRNPKSENEKAKYTVRFRVNQEKWDKLESLFQRSGFSNRTDLYMAIMFEKEIEVRVVDENTKRFYLKITNFLNEYKAIGRNYNQLVKKVNSLANDKMLLYELQEVDKLMVEIKNLSNEVLQITQLMQSQWLQE